MATKPVPKAWTVADAMDTYNVRAWGGRYFGINDKGDIVVLPQEPGHGEIDLKELVDEVRRRGILPPLLLRFSDVLHSRIVDLHEAFGAAQKEYGYRGGYRGVYPVKVNQDRWVLEEVVRTGRQFHYGLEAGTKPELLAVLSLVDDDDALIVCNGYKDEEYIEAALLSLKLGRKVILVVEKYSELELIADMSKRMGIPPKIGIRVKLSSRGAGRWEASGGDRAKFGLAPYEVMRAVDFLKANDMLDAFTLLHFHLGSQISSIRSVKNALREATRFYVELYRLGAPLGHLDVGGGLGIDYDGSQTNFSSSTNYTLQEYANDVVYYTLETCDAADVPHPTLVSESGRAVVAHHAVIVTEVLGVAEMDPASVPETVDEDADPVLRSLHELYREVSRKNFLETYHDAVQAKEEILSLFSLGHLSLDQRVMADNIYWALCRRIQRIAREVADKHEDLEPLERSLADIYFLNFSLFQSVPDSWAVDQLFPIVPLHRLQEEPARRAVLADITCDSDGKIDQFIDRRDVKDVLEVHPLTDEPYYLGIFLVGAYQESLGDLHNLFGNTNQVMVSTMEGGGYRIEHVEPGESVTQVLEYCGHRRNELLARMRRACEDALQAGRITLEDSREILKFYDTGLSGYTYLERE